MPATAGFGEQVASRGNSACTPGAPFRGPRLPENGFSRGDLEVRRRSGAKRRDGGGDRSNRLQGSRANAPTRNFGLREPRRFRRGSCRHGGEAADQVGSFGARNADVAARYRVRDRTGCAAAEGIAGHSCFSMALPSLRTKRTVRPSKTAFMSMSGYQATSFSIRLPTTRKVPGASDRLTT